MKLKTFILASGLLLLSSSCNKQACASSTGIVGEWELIEELIDPGDGSGTFQPISSNKEIKFCDDGTFEANGEMCMMENQASSTQEGTYDVTTNTFSPNSCMIMAPMSYSYSVNGDVLILTYPCIEGCQQKYCRI
ncbi:MAG: hypothetical protein HRT58_19300 [Crocinitomicaceae bacterium]|nr:hypothetical protein [Flavobacteriales bacterium]NQZ37818.1 hypothetical protein [Crocinitomicaceae bacterium]